MTHYVLLIVLIILAVFIFLAWVRETVIIGGNHNDHHGHYIPPYPFLRDKMTIDDVRELFKRLQNTDVVEINKNSAVDMTPLQLSDPERMISQAVFLGGDEFEPIVDYFQEPLRIKCHRDGLMSPLQAYESRIRRPKVPTNPEMLRRELRRIYRKDCDMLAIPVSKWVYDTFLPKSGGDALLMCGGWGADIVALLASRKFRGMTAVDPNEPVVDGWSDIVRAVRPDALDDCTFIKGPFQTADLGTQKYDLMYTSPPYFSSERYSDHDGQSFLLGDRWLDDFLKPSLAKVWKHLRPGGYVVLQLNDAHDKPPYTQQVHDFMDTLPGAKYIGTWSFKKYAFKKNHQPLFVWILAAT